MDAFILGFQNLMTFPVIIAILIGSVGGVIIGAVPGIGPAIAIAILLPATVFLDDLISLVLLLGVYGSSMYGGAIPAILINTPGTPVNALTTYDGYAMTRRGEASRALSLAYSSSFLGGVFSILAALIALFVLLILVIKEKLLNIYKKQSLSLHLIKLGGRGKMIKYQTHIVIMQTWLWKLY